ncbi:MAG: MtrB/PioB family decaheme-associated outer membrane protein [Burkholderiales bacterium]|jgi:MtrB/PioB family decaheme-associated outer membrane protein|nr:MtrB/PioB family decaheme-associated outer membrane protein [Burkholderiales bacterium]
MKTNRFDKSNTNTRWLVMPFVAAIATILAMPLFAEPYFWVPMNRGADMSRYDENHIELGIMINNEDSFKVGEWTGLTQDKLYWFGGFNFVKKDAASADYWNLSGTNIGLDSRQFNGSLGKQGTYSLTASYQGIPHNISDSTRFIYDGLGSNHLTLPSGFPGIAGQPPMSSVDIEAALKSYDVALKRNTYKLGGSVFITPEIQALVDFRRDQRDGTYLMSGVFGHGGSPRSAIFPYSLDDSTDQIDAKIRWSTDKAQLEAGYYYSHYDAGDDRITWQNAYHAPAAWTSGTGFPNGFGQSSFFPDNHYHQLRVSGGYNLPLSTRITGVLSYGISRQNQSFLPYTINTPALDSPALPRNSLDGKVDTKLANLSLTSRPLPKLSVKARYRYYEYDNKTPLDLYNVVTNDTVPAVNLSDVLDPDSINSSQLRYNSANSKKENRFDIDAGYSIMPGFSVRGYYNFKKTDYSPSAANLRDDTKDQTAGIELHKTANEYITGWVKYERSERTGSLFDNARLYRWRYTDGTVSAGDGFDTLPSLRQFLAADYQQDRVYGSLNITPTDTVSVSLLADWNKRKYKGPDCGGTSDQILPDGYVLDATCMGRTQSASPSYTIDLQWIPMEGLSTFGFYTWSRAEFDQISRWVNNRTTSAVDQTRNWTADLKSANNTVGIGMRFTPEERQYDYGFLYVYDFGKWSMSNTTGGNEAFTNQPLPDATYRMSSFQLFGSYQWNKNWKLRATYAYERLRGKDWAYDGAAPAASNNVLGANLTTANYHNSWFFLTAAYLFE